MKTDYNEASSTYDNTRGANSDILALMDREIGFNSETRVLDFGCGTGNYLHNIKERFGCQCYGVEPSEGMLERARAKNPEVQIRKGDHHFIPFSETVFDLIYMTDVIHHVPDIEIMFRNLCVKLAADGKICILTESHTQIESRWYNDFFPSLVTIEKRRYPDIDQITDSAQKSGLRHSRSDIIVQVEETTISDRFLRMVEEKNYSMFRELTEEEWSLGLGRMRERRNATVSNRGHGETLIWFEREGA